MSAWIVSKGHIDAMVQQCVIDGLVSFVDTDAIGQELWQENHRSIFERYGDRHGDTGVAPEYHYEGVEAPLDDAIILALVHCFHYQCAEWSEYNLEPGYLLTDRLRATIAARHGLAAEDTDAHLWRDAPWGIDSIEEAIRR